MDPGLIPGWGVSSERGKNMTNCLQCEKEIEIVDANSKYKKFCNRICSGTYNSTRRTVNPEWFSKIRKERICKECGIEISESYASQRYCSDQCRTKHSVNRNLKKLESGETKSKLSVAPFENMRLYITTSGDNRKKAFLYALDRKELKYSMSYARYLMCIHLGRILEEFEHVDHINNDPLDDRIENLQILSQKENTQKFNKEVRKGKNMVEMLCNCGIVFIREKRNTHLVNASKKRLNTFCSKECSHKFGSSLKESKTVLLREFKEFS